VITEIAGVAVGAGVGVGVGGAGVGSAAVLPHATNTTAKISTSDISIELRFIKFSTGEHSAQMYRAGSEFYSRWFSKIRINPD
jgi:hypothetical protein|tara:strand:- start:6251 stop:6499 length:249 start_codon:yes stop_codon:yes gene_type:complete